MSKNQKHDPFGLYEDGKIPSGSICKPKNIETHERYIIGGGTANPGEYFAKFWFGPKPWDFLDITIYGDRLEILENEENPTLYDYCDRYPGPSSTMIKKLNTALKSQKVKELTAKERERNIEAMEEELNKKRSIGEIEIDSVVADDDDEELDVSDTIDPVEKKRKEIIDEE